MRARALVPCDVSPASPTTPPPDSVGRRSGPGARLLVCRGADCRRSKGYAKLLRLASTTPGSATVACQDVCDGPVAGVQWEDGIRWYRRIRGRWRRRLRVVLAGEAGRRALREREVRSRRRELRHRRRLRPFGARALLDVGGVEPEPDPAGRAQPAGAEIRPKA